MKFEWDPAKNRQNIKKHRIDFKEAETVFEDERAVEMYDEEHSQSEDRFKIIGMSGIQPQELYVCHCYRNGGEIIRIISARRATKLEAMLYYEGGH